MATGLHEASDFAAYRRTHVFKFPCCLCPFLSERLGQVERSKLYTESAVYLTKEGPYKHKYVAQCAKGRCGYLVPLETIFPLTSVQLKKYPRCALDDPAPGPIWHYTEMSTEIICRRVPPVKNTTPGPARGLKRTYTTAAAMFLDAQVFSPSPPRVRAKFTFTTDTVPVRAATSFNLFGPAPENREPKLETWQYLKLKAVDEKFRHLFAKCANCGVLKKRAGFHVCVPPEVIDLTEDDLEDEAMDWMLT
ncbi:hypothetical protein BD410DRAFT_845858 [Rickenella mellea]|uniref:Uncharacterized protein n=1 Tax=Rickenella mellea TaxID=50990 RepID=A0A4Y7PJA4_9AGAM|nr:hypothetical protein BD410DRAFT_845858 [Rickenella mellea]